MPTKAKAARRKPATPPASALPARREPDTYDMSNPAMVFAQLARDKTIDADRLEKLIHLQERIIDRNAKVAFNAAFAAMATELPVISRRGEILNKDGKGVRSRYSKLEDIQHVCKPILKRFGFAIRHRTEWPADKPGIIRIVGILAHVEGHSEESAFEAGPDKNDYRSALQDRGSTVSYGRRYTIIDLLNLEQQGIDNDGQPSDNEAGGARSGRARSASPEAQAGRSATGSQASPTTHGHSDGNGGAVISQAQRKRLWTIAGHANRSKSEVTAWLSGPPWNLASSKDILRRDYDTICKAIEAPGTLPGRVVADREPGEEG